MRLCWASRGIIAKEESDKIIEGLKGILADIEAGKIHFSQDYEDIHMNVEQILTERIGDAGKRLHTARSRNDQVALDMRLYVKKEIVAIKKGNSRFHGSTLRERKEQSGNCYAGLYTSAACTAGYIWTLYDGICQYDAP